MILFVFFKTFFSIVDHNGDLVRSDPLHEKSTKESGLCQIKSQVELRTLEEDIFIKRLSKGLSRSRTNAQDNKRKIKMHQTSKMIFSKH